MLNSWISRILWPKIQNTIDGLNLTLIGGIRDEIVGVESLANYLIQLGKKRFPQKLWERYKKLKAVMCKALRNSSPNRN